jgi:hypothetical protein
MASTLGPLEMESFIDAGERHLRKPGTGRIIDVI